MTEGQIICYYKVSRTPSVYILKKMFGKSKSDFEGMFHSLGTKIVEDKLLGSSLITEGQKFLLLRKWVFKAGKADFMRNLIQKCLKSITG